MAGGAGARDWWRAPRHCRGGEGHAYDAAHGYGNRSAADYAYDASGKEVARIMHAEIEAAVAIDHCPPYEEGGEALAGHHEQHEGY